MLIWDDLLNPTRFSQYFDRQKAEDAPIAPTYATEQFRLPAERDHDRILFSAPLRRMGDKTQVFPLDSIESIHNRLTHSHEVANLARSLGIELAVTLRDELPENALRVIPAMLAAAGLAHDIGNPPFGHQGERAIRFWFERNSKALFKPKHGMTDAEVKDIRKLRAQHRKDFLLFEGNAQTLRILTKLQVIGDDLGLNLTFGTLASLMKYIVPSHKTNKKRPACKKFGYFLSETDVADTIRKETGLNGITRHPLALIMEACDDIAYSVIDAEDSVKKSLVSFNDLLAWLDNYRRQKAKKDEALLYIGEVCKWEYDALAAQDILPGELNDVATQKFRVRAIHVLIAAVAKAFRDQYCTIMQGAFEGELIEVSEAANLCRALKDFNEQNAFSHRSVLEIELDGYNVINELMDFFWTGITERDKYFEVGGRRKTPFASYVYSRLSRNYRRVFEGSVNQQRPEQGLLVRYKEMQLMTDMISGMTDRFCLDLRRDLRQHYRQMRSL